MAKKKINEPEEFRVYEPSGEEVKAFRESIIVDGSKCTQRQFAAAIRIRENRMSKYEQNAEQMPDIVWTLLRITWDKRLRAQWEKTVPQRDT